MTTPSLNGNGRATNVLLIVNFAGLISLTVWIATIAFSAGQRVQQILVNQIAIEHVLRDGSEGTKARLDAVERRIDQLENRFNAH